MSHRGIEIECQEFRDGQLCVCLSPVHGHPNSAQHQTKGHSNTNAGDDNDFAHISYRILSSLMAHLRYDVCLTLPMRCGCSRYVEPKCRKSLPVNAVFLTSRRLRRSLRIAATRSPHAISFASSVARAPTFT